MKKIEIGTKIEYLGNIYEYIGDEKGWMYFQSVNDDSWIRFYCTNIDRYRFYILN